MATKTPLQIPVGMRRICRRFERWRNGRQARLPIPEAAGRASTHWPGCARTSSRQSVVDRSTRASTASISGRSRYSRTRWSARLKGTPGTRWALSIWSGWCAWNGSGFRHPPELAVLQVQNLRGPEDPVLPSHLRGCRPQCLWDRQPALVAIPPTLKTSADPPHSNRNLKRRFGGHSRSSLPLSGARPTLPTTGRGIMQAYRKLGETPRPRGRRGS